MNGVSAQDFLVELGTEELPPLALPELERSFAAAIRSGLAESAVSHGPLASFATPRRLAVLVRDVAPLQNAQALKLKGPPVSAAFDKDGNALTVYWHGGKRELSLTSKNALARQLIEVIAERYKERDINPQPSTVAPLHATR